MSSTEKRLSAYIAELEEQRLTNPNNDDVEDSDVLCHKLLQAVNASVQVAREKAEDERERLLAEAKSTAAKVTEEVNALKTQIEKFRVELDKERKALELEKASMERAHTFQKNKIKLNVGGYRFETSLQTLTSVPGTYFASFFSGRFPLTPDEEDGAYFTDRSGRHFHLLLDYMRSHSRVTFDVASSDMTASARKELEVEAEYYGMLDHLVPFLPLERIGRSLLERACLEGTRRAIQTAVAQARALVFDMGSTTPFLSKKFQDVRYAITDRVVNGSPVWAASDGEHFMYRNSTGYMMVSSEDRCIQGLDRGFVYNRYIKPKRVVAPTDLPSDMWVSCECATLPSHYSTAEFILNGEGDPAWAPVPDMCITVVHGLSDDDPTMAKALQKLAAFD